MEKREKILKVKLNEKQYQILENLIERTGLTKSEIVRYLLVFQSQNVPSRQEIQKLKRELAGISNNLNQIARAVNIYNKQGQINNVIEQFKQAIRQVNELMNALDSYKK